MSDASMIGALKLVFEPILARVMVSGLNPVDRLALLRLIEEVPEKVLRGLRESGAIVRAKEEADWPVTARIEKPSRSNPRLTAFTTIKIGVQMFEAKQEVDQILLLYERRSLIVELAKMAFLLAMQEPEHRITEQLAGEIWRQFPTELAQ